MKKYGFRILLALSFFWVVGCSVKTKQPEWKFEKEAIRVHIKADHKLNLYNRKAHTLYVCFYQLSELNKFDQLTQDSSGIQKLLDSKLFDPSVAAVKSKIIHAGENLTVILDRAEKTKYFAIVTGYYAKLDKRRMVRQHKIQAQKKRVSFWTRKYQCMPCDIDIELALGANQIEYSKVIKNNKRCSNECK